MIVVTAGIVVRAGQVLIAQRKPDDTLGGLWEFPGGKMEPGETPDQCIVRELREELDIDAKPMELYDTAIGVRGRILILFYLCCVYGEPKPMEGQEIKLIDMQTLRKYPFAPADMSVAEKLANDLRAQARYSGM